MDIILPLHISLTLLTSDTTFCSQWDTRSTYTQSDESVGHSFTIYTKWWIINEDCVNMQRKLNFHIPYGELSIHSNFYGEQRISSHFCQKSWIINVKSVNIQIKLHDVIKHDVISTHTNFYVNLIISLEDISV